MNNSEDQQKIGSVYQQQAVKYDQQVRLFNIFAWIGFNISGWREQAVSELELKPGDSVVDIGCGTGLNFSYLYPRIGTRGRIIGVDLSPAMLEQAQQSVKLNQWDNIDLVCADAAQYEFPRRVDAVLSTYALTLIPECRQVINNACDALAPGGRLVILDMAWPEHWPLWWRHVLFFLRSYGVTIDVLHRRPWETVQDTMAERLLGFTKRQLWFGFFYLAAGSIASPHPDLI